MVATTGRAAVRVEGSRSLDVTKLARAGYLSGATAGSWQSTTHGSGVRSGSDWPQDTIAGQSYPCILA